MISWIKNYSFLLALILMMALHAVAQVETGSIAGTITDQSGAVVPNATVVAKNLGTNAARSTVSNSVGLYQLSGLVPATYEVSVSSSSFKPFAAKVQVTVGAHVSLDGG